MEKKNYLTIILMVLVVLGLVIGGLYVYRQSDGQEENDEAVNSNVQLSNSASMNCVDKGGELEIRTGDDGGQYGMCKLPDGRECEEWALFRGECDNTDQ